MTYKPLQTSNSNTAECLANSSGSIYAQEEMTRSDALLYQLLPSGVADVLRSGQKVQAAEHQEVTVLFSDLVGFMLMSNVCTPMEIINLLDSLCE